MAGQLGLATESTPGTGVTVTKFFPVENATQDIVEEKLYRDDDIRASRLLPAPPKLGRRIVRGKARMKLPNVGGAATLLKHVFGGVATTGAGPYTHTYSLGTSLAYATIQYGVTDAADTTQPFTHVGCCITDWKLSVDNKGWVILEMSWVGIDYSTATALAAASYTATSPFTFVEGSLTMNGSAVAPALGVELVGTRDLDSERFGIRASRLALKALRKGGYKVLGTVRSDFEDLDMVNLIASGAGLAVVFTLSNGTESLTTTMNVVLDGDFPNLTTKGLEEQMLKFNCNHATSDASAFTPVLINSEASAA